MKQIVLAFGLLAIGAAYAAPRFLVIPLEDVEFMEEMDLPVYSMPPMGYPPMHHRVRRQAPGGQAVSGANEAPVYVQQAERRAQPQEGIPAFSIPAEIRQAEDAITAGSNSYGHASHGPDYVDYGAYTGGYGAFGWYSDHPVLHVGGGYHR